MLKIGSVVQTFFKPRVGKSQGTPCFTKIGKSKFAASLSKSLTVEAPSPSNAACETGNVVHGVPLDVSFSSILRCATAVPAPKSVENIVSKTKKRRRMAFSITAADN